MTTTKNLPKTQAATLEAIRNLPATAKYGKVKVGISYAGQKDYKGINGNAVDALIEKGLLILNADRTVDIAPGA
jgi:hypothetical protein